MVAPCVIPTYIPESVPSCTAPSPCGAYVPPKYTFLSTSCYSYKRKYFFVRVLQTSVMIDVMDKRTLL